MEKHFSNKFPDSVIDDMMTRWLCLYIVAREKCEVMFPLMFWIDLKRTFDIKDKYFEKRLKYNFDNIMKQIQKRD